VKRKPLTVVKVNRPVSACTVTNAGTVMGDDSCVAEPPRCASATLASPSTTTVTAEGRMSERIDGARDRGERAGLAGGVDLDPVADGSRCVDRIRIDVDRVRPDVGAAQLPHTAGRPHSECVREHRAGAAAISCSCSSCRVGKSPSRCRLGRSRSPGVDARAAAAVDVQAFVTHAPVVVLHILVAPALRGVRDRKYNRCRRCRVCNCWSANRRRRTAAHWAIDVGVAVAGDAQSVTQM